MANHLNIYDTERAPQFRKTAVEFLRATDAELSPEEFTYALSRLGINHVEFCTWLGLNRKQGRRYASGDIKVPKAVGKLLTLMVRLELTPEQV
jgi:hypothetical protein